MAPRIASLFLGFSEWVAGFSGFRCFSPASLILTASKECRCRRRSTDRVFMFRVWALGAGLLTNKYVLLVFRLRRVCESVEGVSFRVSLLWSASLLLGFGVWVVGV